MDPLALTRGDAASTSMAINLQQFQCYFMVPLALAYAMDATLKVTLKIANNAFSDAGGTLAADQRANEHGVHIHTGLFQNASWMR